MRIVTYGAATTLDGYLAREDHSVDWLLWSTEVDAISKTYWATIDTVVMGRKTYEVAQRSGTKAYPGVANYVCSRTLVSAPGEVRLETDGVALVRRLKTEPGLGICIMGGGELARSLIDQGLVDQIGVNLHPILLGSGIPLLPAPCNQQRLRLTTTQALPNGCVYSLFDVVQRAPPVG